MIALRIRWGNKESKNYVDIIPATLFDRDVQNKEIEHRIRRPNGASYAVRSTLDVSGNVATLTYRQSSNRSNSVWPGVTRIVFETQERRSVRAIDWQDEGESDFATPDPSPVYVLSEHDEQADAQRSFAIKTDTVQLSGGLLSLRARPITKMDGEELSVGDRVFVWVLEDTGGQGIEWCGSVVSLDKRDSDEFHIQLSDLHRAFLIFGSKEIDQFKDSKLPQELGLFNKLKGYSHRGIRRLDQEEAERLIAALNVEAFGDDGQNETERLTRLGVIASRPNQAVFSANLRRVYEGKCALTGCNTAQALEAAHIKVRTGIDDNDLRNGILLRADLHALFDEGLIALTLGGTRVEVSARLTDPSYNFLQNAMVFQPTTDWPSEENIRHHHLRFGFHCS